MSEMTWGYLMATYLFLGGLAGGSYIVSALSDLFKGDDYEVLSKSGALVSLVAVILSVVVLLLEIKRFVVQPLVFLNAYRMFPNSMVSVGTWVLTGLLLVSAVTCALMYLGGNWLVKKLVIVVGLILGLTTTAYTGQRSPFLGFTISTLDICRFRNIDRVGDISSDGTRSSSLCA
jgi:formate-dependent nitrite reductase membrane component NrfD